MRPTLLLAGAVGLGGAIFLVDTLSSREFAVAVLYVLVVLIAARRRQPWLVRLAALACAAMTIASFAIMHRFALSGTPPLRTVVSLAAIGITTRLALAQIDLGTRLETTSRERTSLARFLPQGLVAALGELDAPLTMARQGPAAILFADMIGFTSRTAGLPPPAVIALVRRLSELFSTSVARHGGTVDKFLGDGVLAVFGMPSGGRGDASDAVLCAFDMLSAARHDGASEAPVDLAVGIHFGEVVQGDIGDARRLELTVVGDVVNVASRLEGHCRTLGVSILVSAAVIEALHAEGRPDLAERFVDLGMQMLRGRAEPIHVFGAQLSPARP